MHTWCWIWAPFQIAVGRSLRGQRAWHKCRQRTISLSLTGRCVEGVWLCPAQVFAWAPEQHLLLSMRVGDDLRDKTNWGGGWIGPRIGGFGLKKLTDCGFRRADSRIWKILWIAGQLKVLARFPDSVSLEVRIVDRIITCETSPAAKSEEKQMFSQATLVNVLVFCRLTFHFRGFWKRLSRDPTHIHVF